MSYMLGKEMFDKLNAGPMKEALLSWAQIESKVVASVGAFLNDVKEETGKDIDFDSLKISTNGKGDAVLAISLKDRPQETIDSVGARLAASKQSLDELRKKCIEEERKVDRLTETYCALRILEAHKGDDKEATE